MVMRSRTFGMLCSVTFSAVNKAAAITRSAFPPLIRNLSIPLALLFVEAGALTQRFGLRRLAAALHLCASLCSLLLCVIVFFLFLTSAAIPPAPFANLPPPQQSTSSPLLLPRPASTSPAPLAYCVPPPAARVPP